MRSLFFQDHCGFLDVFQILLMVFSPVFPGCKEETAISLSLVTVCLAVVFSLPEILRGSLLSPLSSVPTGCG